MELWDAYFSDGSKSGETLVRGEPIPPQYRHAVTEVLVVHQDGTALLMRRDLRKSNYPGFWEASAGGSVLKGAFLRRLSVAFRPPACYNIPIEGIE